MGGANWLDGGLIVVAVALAAVAAMLGVFALLKKVRRAEGRQSVRRGAGLVLEVRSLRPAAVRVLRRWPVLRQKMEWAAAQLHRRGLHADGAGLASAMMAGELAVGLASGIAGGSVFWVLLGAVGAAVAELAVLEVFESKEQQRQQEGMPEVVRSLNRCVQAGMTLPQILKTLADECDVGFRELFVQAAERSEMGVPADEVLDFIREQTTVPELAFLVVALEVQHRTGGSMSQVMETTAQAVQGRLDLARQLRVQTAQAKSSAVVVTLLPFGLLAVLSLMSPGFLDPFFQSVAGWVLLGLAVSMQAAGILVVRRILQEVR